MSLRNVAVALSAALMMPFSLPAQAGSSVLIWPVNPQIASDERAVPLWLENRGNAPVKLQVRVLRWKQQDNDDVLEAQTTVQSSPPMAVIEPGKKQLIRLVRTAKTPAGQEEAFRVLVDEVPEVRTKAESSTPAQSGINLQMRYSVPLFTYGDSLRVPPRDMPATAEHHRPQLAYRLIGQGAVRVLEVSNTGPVRARLSAVTFVTSHVAPGNAKPAAGTVLAAGLLGYVLPGATMRWPMPTTVVIPPGAILQARVNDDTEASTISARGM